MPSGELTARCTVWCDKVDDVQAEGTGWTRYCVAPCGQMDWCSKTGGFSTFGLETEGTFSGPYCLNNSTCGDGGGFCGCEHVSQICSYNGHAN